MLMREGWGGGGGGGGGEMGKGNSRIEERGGGGRISYFLLSLFFECRIDGCQKKQLLVSIIREEPGTTIFTRIHI